MNLKERLLTYGYDHIDILVVDEEANQSTIPDITLHKITDLEYKLYLDPETITYYLDDEHPHFAAKQKDEEGEMKAIKGFILEW